MSKLDVEPGRPNKDGIPNFPREVTTLPSPGSERDPHDSGVSWESRGPGESP